MQKTGWFDSSEIVLYCSLRRNVTSMYGQEYLRGWIEEQLKTLPQAETMRREDVWQRSILSTSCDAYR
jgi:hypothetical protein